jgi:ferrous iron transport protein B
MNASPSATQLPAVGGSPKALTVALVGNPNTGKTTLFNALAGMRQRVGNYPGVTVETKKGHVTCAGRSFAVVDLPGTYSLAPRSPDEMVAVDLLLGRQDGEPRPDVIVSIVDASNLERNLYLTTQALDLGMPVVLALNMIDVAEAQGLRLDVARLERQLGVRVVPLQANKGRGLEQLKQAIAAAATAAPPGRRVVFPEAFEREVAALRAAHEDIPEYLVRRLLLDAGGYTEARLRSQYPELNTVVRDARQRLAAAGCPVPAVEARTRYAWIREAIAGCVERPAQRPVTWTDRLDRVLTHRVWGTLIFLALMFVVFQSIFTWARPLMKAIGAGKDWLADGLRGALPPGPLSSLLTDGVLEGVGGVLVFLPQIIILFGFIAVLEDCGYMARAAFLMDRLMARCGLSGKSFIPLLSSVACAVPGILAARVIENRRDRLATILVAPLMSCSARLPVYILLTAAFLSEPWWLPGVVMFGLYALGLVLAPVVAWALKRTLLRGETPVFVMEMPLYKWPSARTVVRRMTDSAGAFLRRAGTLILASMVLVWALLYFPRGDGQGGSYDVRVAEARERVAELAKQKETAEGAEAERLEKALDAEQEKLGALHGEWKRQSLLGRMGRGIEPVVRPLGWDWKVGMAALASFPAREVVVGTLGIIYNLDKVDSDEIREAANPGDTKLGQALKADAAFGVPAALSLLVFFALCCQCASTLAVIKRETNSWRWPAFTFIYMTVLAYVGALLTYQVGRLFVG